METILYNYDKLTESLIDEVIVRNKALIVNSNNEIFVCHSSSSYHFPGGHLEEGETNEQCLIREVKEETGIDIKKEDITPLLKTIWYTENYHGTNKNRENDVYFYKVNYDGDLNISKSNLTESEKKCDFKVEKISFDNIEQVLIDNISINPINEAITKEMLEAIKVYKKELKNF